MSAWALAARQLAAEQRLYWRNRASAFFTFAVPVVVLFGALPFALRSRVDGHPYTDVFLPGMLALATILTTFAGLAITLVIRRESGVLKRMRGTPLPPLVYLGGLVASLVVVLVLETVLVLGVGAAFGAHLPARLDEVVGLVALGAACFGALGVAASALVANAEGSSAVVNAMYLPMLLLSGAFFPVHRLPSVLRGIAEALPLTGLVDALHAVFRDGRAGAAQLSSLGVLVAWGIAGAVLARRSFRWEPRGA